MDIYTVNPSTLAPDGVIDKYETMIWTDRYSSFGDFQLTVLDSEPLVSDLRGRTYLRSSVSNKLMLVETIKPKKQVRGRNLIEITGRSMEHYLMYRSSLSYAAQDAEKVSGSAGAIIRYIVNRYCVDPATAGANNVITGLTVAPEITGDYIILYIERKDIYSIAKEISDANGLGFYIDTNLVFGVYKGTDFSVPGVGTYVEYSEDTGDLKNTSNLESIANYKNHARMIGNKATIDVYPAGMSPQPTGIDRRTIVVQAKDIGPDGTTTIAQDQAALTLRGREILSDINNKYFRMVDGEFRPDGDDTYLSLGNVISLKDLSGVRAPSRITEIIHSMDATGYKITPTFEAI